MQIEFHVTGGEDDGPSMTVEHGDCRIYPYAVDGGRLTFEAAHGDCVREHGLAAILATRPWRRAG